MKAREIEDIILEISEGVTFERFLELQIILGDAVFTSPGDLERSHAFETLLDHLLVWAFENKRGVERQALVGLMPFFIMVCGDREEGNIIADPGGDPVLPKWYKLAALVGNGVM